MKPKHNPIRLIPGMRAVVAHEDEITQELLDRYPFNEPAFDLGEGIWTLYRMPEGAEDIIAESDKQAHLEKLYMRDGRDNPAHKSHGLYTGLVAAYGRHDD